MHTKKTIAVARVAALVAWCGLSGSALGADTNAPAPAPVIRSANDPTKPVPGGVRWFARMHASYVEQSRHSRFDVCFLGDSITQMWPGDLFGKYFGKFHSVNFGIGGDRCENVLWRLDRGELRGPPPKLIVLLIGTNNQGMNTAEEVGIGVTAVVKSLRNYVPDAKILLLGIFPSAGTPLAKTRAINEIIAGLEDKQTIRYADIGAKFLDGDGRIQGGILADGVHLTRKGYEIWGDAVTPIIEEMLK